MGQKSEQQQQLFICRKAKLGGPRRKNRKLINFVSQYFSPTKEEKGFSSIDCFCNWNAYTKSANAYIHFANSFCYLLIRGPNLFFKYFYFLFGTGLFYPFRVTAKVQIFWGSLAGPLTLCQKIF